MLIRSPGGAIVGQEMRPVTEPQFRRSSNDAITTSARLWFTLQRSRSLTFRASYLTSYTQRTAACRNNQFKSKAINELNRLISLLPRQHENIDTRRRARALQVRLQDRIAARLLTSIVRLCKAVSEEALLVWQQEEQESGSQANDIRPFDN